MYIDAFSIDWSNLKFYAFPPISVIARVLSKVKQESAEGIIAAPFWSNQVWYLAMLKMLGSTPIFLNSRKSLLVLPQTPNQVHPMWKNMSMLVVHLSGSLQKANHCQEMLLKFYHFRGEWEQKNSHFKRFVKFCRERNTDPIQATTEMGIEFLTECPIWKITFGMQTS